MYMGRQHYSRSLGQPGRLGRPPAAVLA
jgi:hypothetical protein